MVTDPFVPNDTFITAERNISLITGPNASGKSVYLRQVGVLVYLAHIGSFLPCERAIIGLTGMFGTIWELNFLNTCHINTCRMNTCHIDICISILVKFASTDRIFTRVSSVETVLSTQSSFGMDLNQIGHMLSHHTNRSLCLIDEFGKGTAPVDGIALLASAIKHFITQKAMVVCALHFTEVFSRSVLFCFIFYCSILYYIMTTYFASCISRNQI